MSILNLDCRIGMQSFPDNSFDAIVTDPPYELGFMGKKWDASGISYDVNVWRECLRILKPGGHMLVFGGSRTYHRIACAIEDAGFQIRDQIMWIYGSGFPKSVDQGNGIGTALKPAHEPICVARKPLVGTIAQNIKQYGTGGLAINTCRVGREEIQTNGRGERRNAQVAPLNPDYDGATRVGRWPANIIHDGSDEVTSLFPESPGATGIKNKVMVEEKTQRVFNKGFTYRATATPCTDTNKSASRFFYCAKASNKDRDEGLNNFQIFSAADVTSRNAGSAGLNSPRCGMTRENIKNIHPTVKPTTLMRYLIKLVTPIGGSILDPFAGSGSTGKAAKLEGFNFIGFELDKKYSEIANARIAI